MTVGKKPNCAYPTLHISRGDLLMQVHPNFTTNFPPRSRDKQSYAAFPTG